jgi:hypothetical protein
MYKLIHEINFCYSLVLEILLKCIIIALLFYVLKEKVTAPF